MKRFEYLSMTSEILLPKYLHELNKIGAEGWELVLCEPGSGNAVFKRKMEDKDKEKDKCKGKEKSCKTCKFRQAYMEQRAAEMVKNYKDCNDDCSKDKKDDEACEKDKCD